MTQEEAPLQHRLIEERFHDFVEACRAHTNVQLNYIDDERFLTRYLEFRGVKFNPKLAIYKMDHTFRNPSLMSSQDEIGKDAARYYQVFIKRYAVVIESAFKNAKCDLRRQEHMHLSCKEVEAVVQCLADQLKSERKYINEAVFGFQYSLFVLQFYVADEMKEKIGDLLAEIKFNDIINIVAEIGKVKLQDALECNNVYALTRITLKTAISYSDYSETFALYLPDVGLLNTLTAHITEISYRDYLKEQAVSMIMDNVFELVYNMAHHSDSKTKQKFDATKKALMNFPHVGYDYRGVLIMMSLVHTMDEHELGSVSDEPNVVDTIITYMQEAMGTEERRSNTMSLCELADGLTKLTIKMSNRSKIVNKEGALSALVNMVRHKNPKENASAVRCINSLAQYSDVRRTLLEFPDLVDAMVDLQMATSVNLRAQIDDTLKTIRSCTSEDSVDSLLSGAVAELNVIQEPSTCNNAVRSNSVSLVHHSTKVTNGFQQKEDYVDSLVSGAVAGPSMISETQDITVQGQSFPADLLQFCIGVNQGSLQIFANNVLVDQSTHVRNGGQQKEEFTARGKSEKLKPEDEQTVRRHWPYLIEELDGTQIIDDLYYTGVFDADDRREIMSHVTHKKKTEIMLEKLLNAGPTAFENFLVVLDKNHNFIANTLRE